MIEYDIEIYRLRKGHGMTYQHTSIMVRECMDVLLPERGGVFVDCTLGGGGHSEAILERLPSDGRLIGIDRDEQALQAASQRLARFGSRFQAIRGNFFAIQALLEEENIFEADGILADLGVSSYQLDEASRGFSYQHDAPLDMRMDQRSDFSAYDVVNAYSKEQLCNVIRLYGEEKWASRIAQFIVQAREQKCIETTHALVEIIKAAIPASARREGPHPAKRTFQAIRIEVNGELDALDEALDSMIACLREQGRLAIITFHSLEDRIVKRKFAELANPCTCPPKIPMCICGKTASVRILTKKPIVASKEELEQNPRARSAKLRGAEKINPE